MGKIKTRAILDIKYGRRNVEYLGLRGRRDNTPLNVWMVRTINGVTLVGSAKNAIFQLRRTSNPYHLPPIIVEKGVIKPIKVISTKDENCWYGIDLSNIDLHGVDMSGFNLEEANLRGTDLGSANLRGADLSYTHLRGADLGHADLRNANFKYADLMDVNLEGANLKSTCLAGANLRGANLRYTNLRDADLKYADLEGANLEHVIR